MRDNTVSNEFSKVFDIRVNTSILFAAMNVIDCQYEQGVISSER